MRPVPQQPLRLRVGSVPAIRYFRAHSDALRYLRAGGLPGFLVREVIEMVKRTSGVDSKVEVAPRRLGDPAKIVAASDYIRMKLGWKPQYDLSRHDHRLRSRLGAEIATNGMRVLCSSILFLFGSRADDSLVFFTAERTDPFSTNMVQPVAEPHRTIVLIPRSAP